MGSHIFLSMMVSGPVVDVVCRTALTAYDEPCRPTGEIEVLLCTPYNVDTGYPSYGGHSSV